MNSYWTLHVRVSYNSQPNRDLIPTKLLQSSSSAPIGVAVLIQKEALLESGEGYFNPEIVLRNLYYHYAATVSIATTHLQL